MITKIKKVLLNPFSLMLIVLISLIYISFFLKKNDLKEGVGAYNLEATYHTLLTLNAFNENDFSSHYFLPTITLGADNDKNIPWGAAVKTKSGDYIYTSFTSIVFVTPFIFFKLVGWDINFVNLTYFSFILGALNTLLIFGLLYKVAIVNKCSRKNSAFAALLGSIISIFSNEAMHINGIIYWAHNLYQPIFILSLYYVFGYLTRGGGCLSKKSKIISGEAVIVFLAFLGAMIEWTGYIFNLGLILLLWFFIKNNSAKKLAVSVFIATGLAGLLTILHFIFVIGFENTLTTFLDRFKSRNIEQGSFLNLFNGYLDSYRIFIFVCVLAILLAILYLVLSKKKDNVIVFKRTNIFILLIATFPILENIIMLQHAAQFSFDRVKFLVPLSLLITLCYISFDRWGKLFLTLGIIYSSYNGYQAYKSGLAFHGGWAKVDADNRNIVNRIKQNIDIKCADIISSFRVRGYDNILFHRAIRQDVDIKQIPDLVKNDTSCGIVYIENRFYFTDLSYYDRALIFQKDKKVIVIDRE